jgi:hypothetical protein
MRNKNNPHNLITIYLNLKTEQMKFIIYLHLRKEILDQGELVLPLVKIKIKEETGEETVNKINNQAVEQMVGKE